MMEKVRKPRSDSKMYQLPKDVLDQVDDMLLNENMKYSDIQHWLETEHDMKISLSSISNYAVKIYQAAQRVSDDLERTKFFIDYIGDKSELDASKVTTAILKSGLLQKIATAEEEFQEMPLDKAGRLIASLSRTKIYKDKVKQDMKKKADIAFQEMEASMMQVIKNDPSLAEQLKKILTTAKERMLQDD